MPAQRSISYSFQQVLVNLNGAGSHHERYDRNKHADDLQHHGRDQHVLRRHQRLAPGVVQYHRRRGDDDPHRRKHLYRRHDHLFLRHAATRRRRDDRLGPRRYRQRRHVDLQSLEQLHIQRRHFGHRQRDPERRRHHFLSADNTYSGGTTVNAGRLVVGNGGTTGSIVGNVTVASGAAFGVNRSDTYTVPNAISGAGGFVRSAPARQSSTPRKPIPGTPRSARAPCRSAMAASPARLHRQQSSTTARWRSTRAIPTALPPISPAPADSTRSAAVPRR